MSESLGKSTLELEANLAPFEKNMKAGKRTADEMQHALDAVASISRIAEIELNKVKMDAAQGARSRAVADQIEHSVGNIGKAAMEASAHLEKVKLDATNAAETTAAGDVIDRKLKDVTGNANEARRALESVRLAGAGGVGGGRDRNPGVGVGPFGSGFGRVGVLGAAVGGGALLGPAAGPAALGALAAIPALASAGVGALGTLALAFQGVGKAIGGDKKAYDALQSSQQQFVLTVRSLDGALDKLKQTAGNALFPGLTAGLKSALSPGTMGAITQAVTEFGHAIGAAGAQWGKYFGSAEFQSIFGPLMADGAKNLRRMSDAALRLFDAIGVLARAAIPLTDWIVKGADAGARWADTFLHAKDATGGLSGAMDEAKTSLQLVGQLFAALGRAVYELGAALYPVSKVAVKDLTDGLNALAHLIQDNRKGIREFVSGALGALVDIVKVATPLLKGLATVLGKIADTVGGWKVAFEIILTGALALKVGALVKSISGMKVEVEALGLAIDALPLAGIVIPIVLSITYRKQISDAISGAANAVLGALGADTKGGGSTNYTYADYQWLKKNQPSFARWLLANQAGGNVANFAGAPRSGVGGSSAAATADSPNRASGYSKGSLPGKQKMLDFAAAALGAPYMWGGNGPDSFDCSGLVQWAFANGLNVPIPRSTYGQVKTGRQVASGTGGSVTKGSLKVGDVVFTNYGEGGKKGPGHEGLVVGFDQNGQPIIESAPHTGSKVKRGSLADLTSGGYWTARDLLASGSSTSPFGSDPAWTKNLGPKPPKPSVIPANVTYALNMASQAANRASNLGNLGGTAKRYLENELADLNVADRLLDAKLATAKGKAKTELASALTRVENKIRDVQTLIKNAIIVIGDALLPQQLRTKLAGLSTQFTADSDYASVLVGQAAEDYRSVLRGDLIATSAALTRAIAILKAKIARDKGAQLKADKDELAKLTGELDSVQQQILASLEGTVQALQSKVAAIFGSVKQEMDAAFESQTQDMLDALGVKFFQNGLLTPEEQALADEQRKQTLEGLHQALLDANQAVTDAQQAMTDALNGSLVYDASTGLTTSNVNSAAVKAAQQQLDAANRQLAAAKEAIKLDEEQAAATKSRTEADKAYAIAAKQLQTDRSAAEKAMNEALDKLSESFQNGKGNMDDLAAIAKKYGIQIDTTTIPDFDTLSTAMTGPGGLLDALAALIAYIKSITGTTPDQPPTTAPPTTAPPRKGPGDPINDPTNPGRPLPPLPPSVTPLGGGSSNIGVSILDPLAEARLLAGRQQRLEIPELDTGGLVTQTGLAMVHRGETFSGVGSNRIGSDPVHITVQGFVGSEAELAAQIGKILQRGNKRGLRYDLT